MVNSTALDAITAVTLNEPVAIFWHSVQWQAKTIIGASCNV